VRQHDERDLRTALREEADRHRPDRQAMLDRIAQGRAAYARRPIDRLFALVRPAAAALAVAVVLVLAVAGVRLSNREPEVDDTPVAAPSAVPATTPAPATTNAPRPSSPATTATAPKPPRTTTGTSSSPAVTTPAGSAPQTDRDGYVSSTGKVDPNTSDGWSQDSVVLKSTRKITALDVTVEVALAPGVAETGRWSTVSTDLLTISSSRTNKMLVFRFTLRQGATLAPGEYTFAAQFSHTVGKHSPAADSYEARITGEGKDAKVSGSFTPQQ
jgi:hypothetical protein